MTAPTSAAHAPASLALGLLRAARPKQCALPTPGWSWRWWGARRLVAEQIVQGANARWLGRVSDDEVADLYRAATVVAVPSLGEGCGQAFLEAMACGAPTVASNRGAMPEIAGEGALVADPTPDALADAIREALDPIVADRLRASGPVQAGTFTPEAMGRAGWHALRMVTP